MTIAQRVPVLMYHRVGEPDLPNEIYCVRPENFAAQMRALMKAGWQAVCIEDFDAWLRGQLALPEKTFVITFDDGFTDVHDFAAPILKTLGWPATVFVVAGKLGEQSDWGITTGEAIRPHPLMSSAQLRELAAQGFSVHSHSLLHHDLTTLELSALERDLSDSRTLLADIFDRGVFYLAYPYGRHNETVRSAAQRAGYAMAVSVESGFNPPGQGRFQIRRLDVFGTDTPAMLLRKIRLGTNDGRLSYLMRYYLRRVLRVN